MLCRHLRFAHIQLFHGMQIAFSQMQFLLQQLKSPLRQGPRRHANANVKANRQIHATLSIFLLIWIIAAKVNHI